MADITQSGRPLMLTSPLDPDVLFLRGFTGREGISQLFWFELDLLADSKTDIPFDKILGAHLTIRVKLPQGERQFDGICCRFVQGEREARKTSFTAYRAEIVPQFWLLTHKAQSKICSPSPGELSVPEILKKVLAGMDVSWKIKEESKFKPRNFCVQYRESDFNFASRLMEEEGIFYFFKHEDKKHTMIVSNDPEIHPDVPGKLPIVYEDLIGGFRDDDRIADWEKVQELRSGKYTLRDHSFEMPKDTLEAQKTIQSTVSAGKIPHKLTAGDNSKLELYDWPGEYAQRFDGVSPSGGDRPSDLQKIFDDNKRTVEIRMQQEALPGLLIRGGSNCRQLTSGYKFTVERHFNADGPYILTVVRHQGSGAGEFRGLQTGPFHYENRFECIPVGLPFRPPQVTPKPVVHGTQSAVVVGQSNEEIYTDKYGRIKVQFHWDRDGKNDQNSSCWIRVGTPWAGTQWGMIHIPRVGQEVIVDFLEGDPDEPIVIGSVYNADVMPPYTLPANKTQSGIKSRSSLHGGAANFNEIRFEDKKGHEEIHVQAERNLTTTVEADETRNVGHDRTTTIENDDSLTVKQNYSLWIDKGFRDIHVMGTDDHLWVDKGDRYVQVEAGHEYLTVTKGNATVTVETGNRIVEAKKGTYSVTAKNITLSADENIILKVGNNSIKIAKEGIEIHGEEVKSEAEGINEVIGKQVKLNCE